MISENKKRNKEKNRNARQSKVRPWLSVQSPCVKEDKDQTGSTVSTCFLPHLWINGAKLVAAVPTERTDRKAGKASRGLPSPRHSTPEGRPGRGGVERGRGREQVQQVEPLAGSGVQLTPPPSAASAALCFQL